MCPITVYVLLTIGPKPLRVDAVLLLLFFVLGGKGRGHPSGMAPELAEDVGAGALVWSTQATA